MRGRLRLPAVLGRVGARVAAVTGGRSSPRDDSDRRAAFVRTASGFTPYVAVEREGTLFFLSTESPRGRRLFSDCGQWTDHRRLDRALKALDQAGQRLAGPTFVDIGAHIGTSTIAALRHYGFESGLAFEPEYENFRILRANLAVNDLDNRVRVFNVALANRVGIGSLLVQSRGSGTHELLREGESSPGARAVPVTSFDALAAEGVVDPAKAGLAWIDVEGSEIDVLQGARVLTERFVPMIIEFAPHRFADGGRLDAFIDVLAQTHTHFYDLKPRFAAQLEFEPLSALPSVLTRHSKNTDLLMLRLGGK